MGLYKPVFAVLFCAIFFPAHAVNILVWTFRHNQPDTLTDPEIGTQPASYNYWLKKCLTDNGYSFTVHNDTILPNDISSYDVLFCAFGYRNC